MKQKEPYTYTQGDLQRYHSGAMPEGERHLMERAALEDPFLADALEGFALQPGAAEDVAGLQRALQERTAPRKRQWVPLSAAAALLLTALALWWWLPGPQEGPTALKAPAPQERSTPVIEDSLAEIIEPAPTKPIKPAVSSRPVAAPPARAAKPSLPALDSSTPDSSALVAAPPARYERTSDTLGTIVLQPIAMELEEVVIASASARRRQSLPPTASALPIDSLEPSTGWTDFEYYVADRLLRSEPAPKGQRAGLVRLSFDTDAQGNAVNIRVEASDCTRCEEAAIRLLKEGPRWKKRSRNRARIGIRF